MHPNKTYNMSTDYDSMIQLLDHGNALLGTIDYALIGTCSPAIARLEERRYTLSDHERTYAYSVSPGIFSRMCQSAGFEFVLPNLTPIDDGNN